MWGASASMNCGSRARKKSATFGLSTLVSTPWRRQRRRDCAPLAALRADDRPRSRAAGALAQHAERQPEQVGRASPLRRPRTPPPRRRAGAASPNAAASAWTTQPAMMPSAAASPPRTPWRSVWRQRQHHVDARRRVEHEHRRREQRRASACRASRREPIARPARSPSPSLRRRRCTAPRRRFLPPCFFSAPSSVTTMRAPLAPIGWPSAHGAAVDVDDLVRRA